MSQITYDAIIVGGGIIGCSVALYLRSHFDKVVIIEKEDDIITRASYVNQGRVHNGYHYPRSFLTALRSRINSQRFIDEYEECIDRSFDKYYAIANNFSAVTAEQFKVFCDRIKAPLKPASNNIKNFFDNNLIEDVFQVEEYAVDTLKLRKRLLSDINRNNIDLKINTSAVRVRNVKSDLLELHCINEDRRFRLIGKWLFNCTYSNINQLLDASDLDKITLKYEFAELALVKAPPILSNMGITVMCGPFFSLVPYPNIPGLHILSHVRYTPHHTWAHSSRFCYKDTSEYIKNIPKESNFRFMIMDACRYLPILRDCEYIDSLWEVKTLFPRSDVDDSRPILFKKHHGLNNLTCIIGGKIDNIYDMFGELDLLLFKGDMLNA